MKSVACFSLFALAFFFFSCKETPKKDLQACKIVAYKEKAMVGTLNYEPTYFYMTDCGFGFSSKRRYEVGNTIYTKRND